MSLQEPEDRLSSRGMLDDLTTILHTKNYKKQAVSSRNVKPFITEAIRLFCM
jgi:hypothetical protein